MTSVEPPGGQQPRQRTGEILVAARALLEAEGRVGLSMRRIAERVGIRAPSIYKHFPDKEALEATLVSDGLAEWSELAEAALRSAPDPLGTFARAYRDFAFGHPHLYRLMTERPLPREQLATGVEERAAEPAIAAAGNDADLARVLSAFAHGMTILELNARFPADADLSTAWRRGLEVIRRDMR